MEPIAKDMPDLKPFEYQVAGHAAKSITGNPGILKHKEGGYLLKPINKSPQGEVEIAFYERLESDPDLSPIKLFIPDYFGFQYLIINDKSIRFLKLRDVTSGFTKPCVMDVKIGEKTWDPSASPQKRALEEAKYVESKKEFGFCIPGYVVFNISTGRTEKFGKEDGKKLNRNTTIEVFKHFFNLPSKHSHIIINHMTEQLKELLDWWNKQRIIHLFASSILLTYDAGKLESLPDILSGPADNISDWVKVYMIDFAHVFPADSKDCNYVSGLSKLIEVLKILL